MKSLYAAALAALFAPGAFAQSERDADKAGNLFADHKMANPYMDRIARHEGDIVTVVIQENSNSSYTASTSTSKSDKNSITNGIPLLQGLLAAASTGATSGTSGTGQTTNTGVLTAQMSVIVKKVLPNGNLVIEGTRAIKTNKDTQTFKLTGVIRQDDIRSDNTVLSASINDAHIEVDGKGQIADRQRRGILTRLLDWLF
ncbi:MAG TPA: flagellar basal body L-ring protein FlgH [Fimbriimonadaceae bacterium]|nr:flagellar basal body L-ring protein FlgH [Fimbriimonadaceae bacterium]